MARIRQSDTAIEEKVGAALREFGLSYRKNVKGLTGRPDFANKRRRWAVFVNGCFWHHHTGCRRATIPKSNVEFWIAKFQDNRRRDARAIQRLRATGFDVVVIWECQSKQIHLKLRKILKASCIDAG